MPPLNGNEPRREIRADPLLQNNLFLVLTISGDERDISEAYKKNLADFILKTKAGDLFADPMVTLDNFRRVVELPESHIREVADGSSQNPAH